MNASKGYLVTTALLLLGNSLLANSLLANSLLGNSLAGNSLAGAGTEKVSSPHENLGHIMGSQLPFDASLLNSREKDAFVKGFRKSLDRPLTNVEQMHQQSKLESMMKDLMARTQDKKHRERMARLSAMTAPLDLDFRTSDDDSWSFETLLKEQRGLVLVYWGSWSKESLSALKAWENRMKAMNEKSYVLANVNIEGKAEAEKVRQSMNLQSTCLVEPEDNPSLRFFEVERVPHVVVLNAAGNVKFSGPSTMIEEIERSIK